MRFKSAFPLLCVFSLGCGGHHVRGYVQTQAENLIPPETLKAVNANQNDLRTAQAMAFISSHVMTTNEPSQKLESMAKALATAGCSHGDAMHMDAPAGADFSKDWDFLWFVDTNGTTQCPIHVSDSRQYKIATGALVVARKTVISSVNFRQLGGLTQVIVNGELDVVKVPGGRRVKGGVDYDVLLAASQPHEKISVVVDYESQPPQMKGTLQIMVTLGDAYGTARVDWDQTNQVTYTFNGASIDQKSFDEMFLSLGLSEIIENTKKM